MKLVYESVIRLSVNVVVGCQNMLDTIGMNRRMRVLSRGCRTISWDANYLTKLQMLNADLSAIK